MNKYLYYVDNKPYLNITNLCSNDCDFCIRHDRKSMEGQELWLDNQAPTFQEIVEQFPKDLNFEQEFTFCGFGEPTQNLSAFLQVAKFIKQQGGKVRLNTNGQSDLINGCKTAREICEVTDTVSISLNDSTAVAYQQLCHSIFGEMAFDALLNFAADCKKHGATVVLSVVDVIGQDKILECQKLCDNIGVTLRVRKYIPLSQY